METFPRYWAFVVRWIQRSPVDSPHKGQWRVALIFIWSAWKNGWANIREAWYLKRHRAHYDVTVMNCAFILFSFYSLWTCGEISPWYNGGTSRGLLVKRRIVSDHHDIHVARQILLRIVRYTDLCRGSWVIIVSMINKMRNFFAELLITWKCCLYWWPFAWGIYRSPADSLAQGPSMQIFYVSLKNRDWTNSRMIPHNARVK